MQQHRWTLHHAEWSKSEKKYRMTSLTCGIQKEMIQMNLKNRKRLTDLENELMVADGVGIVREFGKAMYTLVYLKWINQQRPIV